MTAATEDTFVDLLCRIPNSDRKELLALWTVLSEVGESRAAFTAAAYWLLPALNAAELPKSNIDEQMLDSYQFPQYRIRFITKPASAAIKELDFVFRKIGASTHRNEDELIVRERRLEHDALVRILASLAARYEKELQIAELPDTEKTKDFQAPFSPFSFAEAMQLFARSNSLNNSKKLDLWKNIAGIEGDKFCKL